MWHAYHVAGEQLSFTLLGALLYRFRTGKGQLVSCAVHESVSKSTEVDLMTWVMRHALVLRQTCRHAREDISPNPTIVHTKDGRWVMASLGNRAGRRRAAAEASRAPWPGVRGSRETMGAPRSGRFVPGTGPMKSGRDEGMEAVQRFVRSFTYENIPWREAQELGMLWAPLRKPHENAVDEHWVKRGSVTDIEHPELGKSFRYPASKWISTANSWVAGRRAPLLNEDANAIEAKPKRETPVIAANAKVDPKEPPSKRGKPFPLHGIRIVDFSWFLASAGGTRFRARSAPRASRSSSRPIPIRVAAMAPVGGREAATKPPGRSPG
jgi:crotonobetainyl-CoA:carnitine CoA-transferase CaiB-like acyl-CoA transferase